MRVVEGDWGLYSLAKLWFRIRHGESTGWGPAAGKLAVCSAPLLCLQAMQEVLQFLHEFNGSTDYGRLISLHMINQYTLINH